MAMEFKYLMGSKLLKLDNCRDEDWIYLVDTISNKTVEPTWQREIRFQKFINKTFAEGRNSLADPHKALFLYQISREFHNDTNYPFNNFSILAHKKVWIEQLKNYINLDSTEHLATREETLPKLFYHILYQYHMIIEDTVWISAEAKVNVQKIHDLEMPSNYFYELKALINSL